MSKPHLKLVVNKASDRRKADRYEVTDLLDGYIASDDARKTKIQVKDISKHGIAFFVKNENDCLAKNANANLDLYIKGSENYFTCEFKILEVAKDKQGRYLHRAQVNESSENASAIEHLATFIETVRMKKDPSVA